MDVGIVILGAFILSAVIYAEEKKKDEAKDKGEDYTPFSKVSYRTLLMAISMVTLLSGLGFLFRYSMRNVPSWSLLVPFFLGFMAVRTSQEDKGIGSIVTLVAGIAVMAYILLGSY